MHPACITLGFPNRIHQRMAPLPAAVAARLQPHLALCHTCPRQGDLLLKVGSRRLPLAVHRNHLGFAASLLEEAQQAQVVLRVGRINVAGACRAADFLQIHNLWQLEPACSQEPQFSLRQSLRQ